MNTRLTIAIIALTYATFPLSAVAGNAEKMDTDLAYLLDNELRSIAPIIAKRCSPLIAGYEADYRSKYASWREHYRQDIDSGERSLLRQSQKNGTDLDAERRRYAADAIQEIETTPPEEIRDVCTQYIQVLEMR